MNNALIDFLIDMLLVEAVLALHAAVIGLSWVIFTEALKVRREVKP